MLTGEPGEPVRQKIAIKNIENLSIMIFLAMLLKNRKVINRPYKPKSTKKFNNNPGILNDLNPCSGLYLNQLSS